MTMQPHAMYMYIIDIELNTTAVEKHSDTTTKILFGLIQL
jgi:hypothetical protein